MVNTANNAALTTFGYAVESSFAEQTNTYSARLNATSIQVNLSQPMIERGLVQQRQNDGNFKVRGPKGGSIVIEMELYGYGSTTAGSISATPLVTLLDRSGWETNTGSVGTTVSSNWSTGGGGAITGGTMVAGAIVNVGAKNDGRADGQAAVVSGTSSPITLYTNLPAAPNQNDVVYVNQMVYPLDSGAIADSLRFWVATGNDQWWARGCTLAGLGVSGLSEGQVPKVTLTYNVASWDTASETFPSTTATSDKVPILCGAGSFHFSAYNAPTRATYTPVEFALNVNYQVTPLMGPGGADTHQNITGWRRLGTNVTASWKVEAEAAGTHTWADLWNTAEASQTTYQFLYTLAVTNGRKLAIYAPSCCFMGERPKQVTVNGLNYVPIEVACYNSSITTSDLTLSNVRIALG